MGTIDDTRIIFKKKVLPLIKKRNYKKLKSLINRHCFYPISASKSTFLHCSVESDNNEATQYLLNQGFHVNVQDSTGTTPLMIAVRRKYIEIIQTLLAAGADIAMMNYENKSVLHMIFEPHIVVLSIVKLILHEVPKKYPTSEEIVRVLIDAGCHLYHAAYLGNAKVLEFMLEQGFPVNSKNQYNQTALHIAMRLEDIDSVNLLLKYGADAEAMDSCNQTPIHYIYQFDEQHTCEKMELLQILLSVQVSLTSCNANGLFQVSPILARGNDRAISMLLQANIDFTAEDKINGSNVLHYLAMNKNPGVVEQLKIHANKYDANLKNQVGLNSLNMAVGHANVDMVEFLLNQGATPNCAHSLSGITPLYSAYSKFEPDLKEELEQCVELLLQHNADPQFICTKDNKQLTIFDVATESNCLDSLKSVVAHLGLIEGSGVTITEISYAKIELCQPLKEYLNTCQQLLKKKIYGSITLFQLLTADERKMARYFNNGELVPALTNSGYMKHLKSLHSYYYNTLVKRLLKGSRYSILLSKITRVICKIFENRINERHLIIDKVIDCLDNESLDKLYHL